MLAPGEPLNLDHKWRDWAEFLGANLGDSAPLIPDLAPLVAAFPLEDEALRQAPPLTKEQEIIRRISSFPSEGVGKGVGFGNAEPLKNALMRDALDRARRQHSSIIPLLPAEEFIETFNDLFRFKDEPDGLRSDLVEHDASRLIVRGMTAAGYHDALYSEGWTPAMRAAFAQGMETERELAALDARNKPED